MNAATQQEYDSLRADLDRLRDLVDRTNGRLTTLAAKVSDSPARNAVYDACDAITRMNSAASGVRLPRI